jgi:hypothetical protein
MEKRRICRELIAYLKDAGRQGNKAFLHKDKVVINRKIYKLEYLKKKFNMESETQTGDSHTCVENKEMSQHSIQTQNQGTPEQ